MKRLRDPKRTFWDAARERSCRSRQVTNRLAQALGRLEKALG